MNKVILSVLIALLAVQAIDAQIIFAIVTGVISIFTTVVTFAVTIWRTIIYVGSYTFGAISVTATSALQNLNLQNAPLYRAWNLSYLFASDRAVADSSSYSNAIADFLANLTSAQQAYVGSAQATFNASLATVNFAQSLIGLNLLGQFLCDPCPHLSCPPNTYNLPCANPAINCTGTLLSVQAAQLSVSANVLSSHVRSYRGYFSALANIAGCGSFYSEANITAVADLWANISASASTSYNVSISNCSLAASFSSSATAQIQAAFNATTDLYAAYQKTVNCTIQYVINNGILRPIICAQGDTTCQTTNVVNWDGTYTVFNNWFNNRFAVVNATVQASLTRLQQSGKDLVAQLQTYADNFYNNAKSNTITSVKNYLLTLNTTLNLLVSKINLAVTNATTIIASQQASLQATKSATYAQQSANVSAQVNASVNVIISGPYISCSGWANVSLDAAASYFVNANNCASTADEQKKAADLTYANYFNNWYGNFSALGNITTDCFRLNCIYTDWLAVNVRCANTFAFSWTFWAINSLNACISNVNAYVTSNITLVNNEGQAALSNYLTSLSSIAQTYVNCITANATAASQAIISANAGFDGCVLTATTTTLAP